MINILHSFESCKFEKSSHVFSGSGWNEEKTSNVELRGNTDVLSRFQASYQFLLVGQFFGKFEIREMNSFYN